MGYFSGLFSVYVCPFLLMKKNADFFCVVKIIKTISQINPKKYVSGFFYMDVAVALPEIVVPVTEF